MPLNKEIKPTYLLALICECCPVGSGLRIHRPPLQRAKKHNECPVYDAKQSDCEVPVMLEL